MLVFNSSNLSALAIKLFLNSTKAQDTIIHMYRITNVSTIPTLIDSKGTDSSLGSHFVSLYILKPTSSIGGVHSG